MSEKNTQEQPAEREQHRPMPVQLATRGKDANSALLSRVLPDSGLSRLDVAAFNSSI